MWNHVYPLKDRKPHLTEFNPSSGQPCDCRYEVDWNNNIIVHESWDCREALVEACNLVGPPSNPRQHLVTLRCFKNEAGRIVQVVFNFGKLHFGVSLLLECWHG